MSITQINISERGHFSITVNQGELKHTLNYSPRLIRKAGEGNPQEGLGSIISACQSSSSIQPGSLLPGILPDRVDLIRAVLEATSRNRQKPLNPNLVSTRGISRMCTNLRHSLY